MFVPIGDGFHEGGECEVGGSGALGDEYSGCSSGDVMLQEG
jgi:hypothetical protein